MSDWSNEFPQDEAVAYLNHAAVSPWPQRTASILASFAQENVRSGAQHYPKWLVVEKSLRQRLADLINANSSDDIALLKSTSEALSIIAYGLEWRTGDNVIITNQEFPSNRIVWESLQRFGVTTQVANVDTSDPEGSILDQINDKTRLVSVSSVQYASGLKLDCDKIGAACRDKSVLFCIDAIQSIGAHRFDAKSCYADFIAADGHKWMMGPEGTALFYARPEARKLLSINQFGWHMIQDRGNYDRTDWEIARNAQRFECGSPNMLGIHALEASLSLIDEIGLEVIEKQLTANIDYLIEHLARIDGITFITPAEPERRAGILTFSFAGYDHKALHQKLTAAGTICAYRGGGLRFSPHFYTPRSTLDKAVNTLKSLLI